MAIEAQKITNAPHRKSASIFDAHSSEFVETVNDSIKFTGIKRELATRAKADYLDYLAASQLGNECGLDVLDIGCGTAQIHRHFTGHFASLSGIDVSTESVDIARTANPSVSYKSYSGAELPYADSSFNLVFTVCVLHHVPQLEWGNFVAEMHRVLRPGGMAVIFEHNPWNPVTRHAVNNCEFDANAILLSADTSRQLLTDAGFAAVISQSILSVPPVNATLFGLDRALGWLPLGAQYYALGLRT